MRRPAFVAVLAFLVLCAGVLLATCGRPVPTAPAADASPASPEPAPAAAPAPAEPDARITNAPDLAGQVVLRLPPPAAGEVRSVVGGDGAFAIDAQGALVRTAVPMPAPGTRTVVLRSAPATGAASERRLTIAVAAADWSLDLFPELVPRSYTQDAATAAGPLASLPAAGFAGKPADALAAPDGHEAQRLPGRGGIVLSGPAGRHLIGKVESDALALYRWALLVFRAEPGAGGVSTLVRINDGPQPQGRSGNWIPRLDLEADGSLSAWYRGTAAHRLRSPPGSAALDGRWNVALTYRRHGRLFLRVNGVDCGQESPTEGFSAERPEDMTGSRLGDTATTARAWALDGLWLGQSELSERTVAKIEAWALARAGALPGGAAASPAFRPLVDADDFPHRYTFDPVRWAAWKKANTKERRLVSQGRPVAEVQPDRSGWVRVFQDDFRRAAPAGPGTIRGTTVGDSTSDVGAGGRVWHAPGPNGAVGGTAVSKDGNDRPWTDLYIPDAEAGTLTLRLTGKPLREGKPVLWRSAQFASVNDAGMGYSWAGPKGFRVRAKLVGTGPGLFPAPLWFYGLEHMFWRTGERVEFDIVELDPDWDNYGASHVHCGRFPGMFGHSAIDTMKKSTAPEELRSPKLAAGKRVCGVDAWDGAFHTWEVWIDRDLTCINVDGLEVARVDTAPEYLERLFMYCDTALKEPKGLDPARAYDLVMDRVEALQPRELVDAAPPAPFTARPVLSGTGAVGSAVACDARIAGCSDVWYDWRVDGQPRGLGRTPAYTVQPEDRGGEIRCLVRAVGATGQPEAWTAPLVAR